MQKSQLKEKTMMLTNPKGKLAINFTHPEAKATVDKKI